MQKKILAVIEKKGELDLKLRYKYVNLTLDMNKEKNDMEPTKTYYSRSAEKPGLKTIVPLI